MQAVVGEFLEIVVDQDVPFRLVYGVLQPQVPFLKSNLLAAANPAVTLVPPGAPAHHYLLINDGLSGNILSLDTAMGSVVSQVMPPFTVFGKFGIRPTAPAPGNEVWVANQGSQIAVLDMAAQKVSATIPTPSLTPSNTAPVGIVFTGDGNTALYAVSYYNADAAGNRGALLVVDAVNRAVTSTLPLKNAPAALLMAPDSLTAYLLSSLGQLTYYDVLSGTADLTASTFTPGVDNGYSGGNVFVHPDGTRLFWNVGPYLESFDLTTRQVTAQFSSGLPTSSGISLQVGQDGSTATMSNGQGAVVVLDTRYGIIQATFQDSTPTQVFPGN